MATLAGLQLFSAPFDRVWNVKQPDGTVIQIHGWGDDFSAIREVGNYTIVLGQDNKTFMYATRNSDGELVSSGLVVGRDNPASLNLPQHIRADDAIVSAERKERFATWDQKTGNSTRWNARKTLTTKLLNASLSAAPTGISFAPPQTTTVGNKVGLCLLVDFPDSPAVISQAAIDAFCNGDNYTGYGNNGSVKEYFEDVSNHRLRYTNIVTVYLRMPHPKTYYNDMTIPFGVRAEELVTTALNQLKALSNYPTEIWPLIQTLTVSAGKVVACNIYYAGTRDVDWAEGLWPHSGGLGAAQTLGPGVSVQPYQMTDIGYALTLGTFCHENGHMLCDYPDIYDYNYDSSGGAGRFCLMNSGGNGGNPTQPCGYLRMHSGWLDVIDLETIPDSVLTLTTTNSTIFKYTKPAATTEYYLFENRQQSGRDANIPGSGIEIWHCDELGNRDDQRYAYNTLHQNREVQLMQADNQWHLNKGGIAGNSGEQVDLYYLGNLSVGYSNEFADDTAPSSRWWDGSFSELFMGSFSVPGEIMTMSMIRPPPQIATRNPLPEGRVGSPYWLQFTTTDNYISNIWSVIDVATLPAGLTLSPSGWLSGVPTEVKTNRFEIVVKGRSINTTTNTFDLVILPCYTAPYSEGFNGVMEGELTGWHNEYVSNNIPWRTRGGSPSGQPSRAFEGDKNAYLGVFIDNGSASDPYHITRLISPMIQFGPTAREARISFAYYLENRITVLKDSFSLYYKTAWSNNWIGPVATYHATNAQWLQQSFTLPEAAKGQGVYFAFEGYALGGHGISLDAIVVDDPVPPLQIITPSPLRSALCETNYTLAMPLATLASVGGFTNGLGQTNYQYAVVSGTSLPPGFFLTPSGVITGKCNTTITLKSFDVEVTDLISGAKATNTLAFAVEYPRVPVLQENFVTKNGTLPSGWTIEHVANTVDWKIGIAGGKDGRSPPSAAQSDYQYAFFFGTPSAGLYMVSKLVSPVFDLTQMPNKSRLVFWHFMQKWSGQDELRVYYRNVTGGPWTKLETYTDNVSSWTQRSIQLPSPSRTYQIAFEGSARSGYGVCVDTVSVTDEAGSPVILTRDELPSGFDNFYYQTTLEAVGGITPYRWTVVSNALPWGLGLNPDTGIISGTPVGATQMFFRVAVKGYDNKASTNLFSLKILPPGIIPYYEYFNETTLPTGWRQIDGSAAVWKTVNGTDSTYGAGVRAPASAFSGPYNLCLWGKSESKPASLITKSFDLAGCTNTTLSFQLCMKEYEYGPKQDFLEVLYNADGSDIWKPVPSAQFNSPYFRSTNKVLFPSWKLMTFPLPEPSATYRLKFTGTVYGGWGICVDDVVVQGTTSAPPLVITSPTVLPEGTNLVLYPDVTLTATGGTATPYTWRVVTSDVFPPGLTLNPTNGVISGTPTQYGLYTFGITVQDPNNVATTARFSLKIQSGNTAPFDIWKQTYFAASGSYWGDTADQSGDGIPNLIKYGMGLNPTNKNMGIYIRGEITNVVGSANVSDGRYVYLGYRRSLSATDVNFFVKGTTNLTAGPGSWLTNNIVEQLPWSVGETDVWSWVYNVHTIPVTNAPQRFLRLSVERKP
jgi:M6 family metalloprotease-like protein